MGKSRYLANIRVDLMNCKLSVIAQPIKLQIQVSTFQQNRSSVNLSIASWASVFCPKNEHNKVYINILCSNHFSASRDFWKGSLGVWITATNNYSFSNWECTLFVCKLHIHSSGPEAAHTGPKALFPWLMPEVRNRTLGKARGESGVEGKGAGQRSPVESIASGPDPYK